MDVIQKKIML